MGWQFPATMFPRMILDTSELLRNFLLKVLRSNNGPIHLIVYGWQMARLARNPTSHLPVITVQHKSPATVSNHPLLRLAIPVGILSNQRRTRPSVFATFRVMRGQSRGCWHPVIPEWSGLWHRPISIHPKPHRLPFARPWKVAGSRLQNVVSCGSCPWFRKKVTSRITGPGVNVNERSPPAYCQWIGVIGRQRFSSRQPEAA